MKSSEMHIRQIRHSQGLSLFKLFLYKILDHYYRNWKYDYFNSGFISSRKCFTPAQPVVSTGSPNSVSSVITAISQRRQMKAGGLKHTQHIPEAWVPRSYSSSPQPHPFSSSYSQTNCLGKLWLFAFVFSELLTEYWQKGRCWSY